LILYAQASLTLSADALEAWQHQQRDVSLRPSRVRSLRPFLPLCSLTLRRYHLTIKKWTDDLTSFFGFFFSALFILHAAMRL
jgi:hypothetical protein